MPPEIREFFESYRDAFNRLDGEAVARLYAVPSGIASDTGYTHWPTFEPIRDNMVALCELYQESGYAGASYQPGTFLPQGDGFAVTDVSWSIERTEGREPWRFNATYNLMRTAHGCLSSASRPSRLAGGGPLSSNVRQHTNRRMTSQEFNHRSREQMQSQARQYSSDGLRSATRRRALAAVASASLEQLGHAASASANAAHPSAVAGAGRPSAGGRLTSLWPR
jgi:hypothetical protein